MATKVKLVSDGVITPDQITLTTASTGTNTTAPATTAFVQQEISALVDSSPDALNTLNELAAALGDDANFSTTVTNNIALKAPLASPQFTGNAEIGSIETSTNFPLIVKSGTNDHAIAIEEASGAETWQLGVDADGDLGFYNSGSTTASVTFNDLGYVGIGTTSPSEKLHISGSSNTTARIITTSTAFAADYAALSLVGGDNEASIRSIHGGLGAGALAFFNENAERMRIDSLGNIGIGMTSPNTRLNVQSSVGASSYTGVGPGDLIRASGSGQGNWIASEDDGAFAYFGIDSGRAKFAGYNYSTTADMDVIIGQDTFTVKPEHFEVTGSAALTGSFNSTHSNGPYIRFQENGADKFYIGASSAVSGGTYTGYDLYAPAGKTIQIFSEGRTGSIASLQVKSNHIILTQDINSTSTGGDYVVVDKTEEGALHLITETGNARASAITFQAGSYQTQSAITSVHNTSEGTNISVHTTDSYNDGPKERFRFDHHGHARGVSFRGTKTSQPAFALGGGDVVKQNLVLYYNFADSRCYGTSGSTVTDLSGNGNTGNLGANVSYSSTVGGVMDFSGGATSNGAFIGTPLTLPTTDSVSLMFWIYYDDQPASPGDYQLMGWQANGGYAYFGVAANGGSYGYIGRSSSIAENDHIVAGQKWHHLCVTRDAGDSSYGRSYTYIDGILTGFRKSEDPYAHSQTMTIGALQGASNGGGTAGHTLDGKIASVAVYDRALTPPEIHHNMMVDIHRLVGT